MEPAKEPEPEGRRGDEPGEGESGAEGGADVNLEGQGYPDGSEKGACSQSAEGKEEGAAEDGGAGNTGNAGEALAQEVTEPPVPSTPMGSKHGRGWTALRRRFAAGHKRLSAARQRGEAEGDDRGELLFGHGEEAGGEGAQGALAEGAGGDASADTWLVVDKGGIVVAEDRSTDMVDPLARTSVEAKIEQLLMWLLAPAVHGIPKLGVPGAADRAGELLSSHGRDVEAAVREVVAGSERSMSALVLNFCLERIPVFGCPTVLLRTTWGNLRSILIVAALYGHDLEAPRVQHEALLCLVPPGEDAEAAALRSRAAAQNQAQPLLVVETAQKVARMMIKGALKRATGLQAAVDCFELASLLYSNSVQDETDDDGFVHVNATPASAARDYFRRKSLASCALLWCSLPLLVLGMMAPGFCAVARWVPVALDFLQSVVAYLLTLRLECLPALLLAFFALWYSVKTFARLALAPRRGPRRCARLWRRYRRASQVVQDAWPQVVTTLVFLLHAVLPAASTFSACSMIVNAVQPQDDGAVVFQGWHVLHRLSCAVLGIYSLCSVVLLQLQGDQPEADSKESGRTPRPAMAKALATSAAAARGCCVLAAWTYASLALDLTASCIAGWLGYTAVAGGPDGRTALGVVRPVAWVFGANSLDITQLQNEQAMAFGLNLVSVASQQRLVELLSRREVLFRLIGAERVMASTLCLLLKGVAVACSGKSGANPIAEFLTSVAPPPICCVAVVTLRSRALLLGAAAVIGPRIMMSGLLSSVPSFLVGSLAGAYIAHALLFVWYDNRAELDSPGMRLALLVPGGVSGRAKGALRGALVGARTRAVQMMAMGILERAVRWWWRMSRI